MSRKLKKVGLIVFCDLALQGGQAGNVDGPPLHFNEASSVQASQIPGDELANRAQARGQLFIVLG